MPQGQHKTFTYTQTNIRYTYRVKSRQNRVSQKATEKIWNTAAYFVTSTPSYEHRPTQTRRHKTRSRKAPLLSGEQMGL